MRDINVGLCLISNGFTINEVSVALLYSGSVEIKFLLIYVLPLNCGKSFSVSHLPANPHCSYSDKWDENCREGCQTSLS